MRYLCCGIFSAIVTVLLYRVLGENVLFYDGWSTNFINGFKDATYPLAYMFYLDSFIKYSSPSPSLANLAGFVIGCCVDIAFYSFIVSTLIANYRVARYGKLES